jgi:REP element-mobilizing transposase RayT
LKQINKELGMKLDFTGGMARSKAIQQSEFPYHITARTLNKEWFQIPLKDVWRVFEEELYMTSICYHLQVHSFVLMSNHFHLIARTPSANISQCMHRLLGNTSRRLNELGNRINGNFAGRHYKTILHDPSCFLSAYKYVYRNPVDAGLCEKVQDYPYSSLAGLLGKHHFLTPIAPDETLFSDVEGTLEWLNRAPSADQLEAVRYALKRPLFKAKRDQNTNEAIIPLNSSI